MPPPRASAGPGACAILVNSDAFAAWLYRLKPARPEDLAGLLDAAAYAASAEAAK